MDASHAGDHATLLERDHPDYESARRNLLWNLLTPDRRPDVIVRVASEAQVVDAVKLARARGLRIAVRSGGHSWCGAPLRDGGMVIDLSGMRRLAIDAAARVATAEPAVTGSELARALAGDGLAFPVGHCPQVPLGGYLLAGGLGWNSGAWGPACANIDAVRVVTADGRIVTADERDHPDLLWAARGAGPGFFAVVTSFRLRLQPMPTAITAWTYVHRLERLPEIAAAASRAAAGLPRHVELMLTLASAPPSLAERCASAHGRACTVSATAFVDRAADARAAVAPLVSGPIADGALSATSNRPTAFDDLLEGAGHSFPERHRYFADATWSDALPARVLSPLGPLVAGAPSTKSLLRAGLWPASAPSAHGAFSVTAPMLLLTYAVWDRAENDDANRDWHRDVVRRIEPFAAGHYVGEADLGLSGRAQRSFSPTSWRRLQAIRRRWDPDGVFQRV